MQSFKFIVLIVIVLVLAYCKKEYRFPEDPGKSKKTPKERLLGGWHIVDYTFNGNSILDTLNKICQCTLTEDVHMGYFHNKHENRWYFSIVNDNAIGSFGYESLNAFDDYHYLELGPSNSYTTYITFSKLFVTPFKSEPNVIVRWEVTKLFGNDFKVKLNTDTGEFKIHFIKTSDS